MLSKRLSQTRPFLSMFLWSSSQRLFDADWDTSLDIHRSINRLSLLGASLVSWHSKKQQNISWTSEQAEYKAIASTCHEVSWLRNLLLTNFHVIFLNQPPYTVTVDLLYRLLPIQLLLMHLANRYWWSFGL